VKEPVWIRREALEALHGRSLQQFGGPAGLRDAGMLESALARPVNQWAYAAATGLPALAAAYGYGLARNHPFVDGNKRAAFLAVALFLRLNGLRLVADTTDAISTFLDLAAGTLDENGLADWIAAHTQPA
jgi:death on curing protein